MVRSDGLLWMVRSYFDAFMTRRIHFGGGVVKTEC